MKYPPVGVFVICLLIWRAAPGYAQPLAGSEASPAPWVEWDASTARVVSAANDSGAAYPRAKQLSNGEILLAYHHGGGLGDYGAGITLRKSRDGGATWYQTQQVEVARETGFWGFSNADFIELGNGRLLLVSSARGRADRHSRDSFLSEGRHSGLRARFSDNYGATWSAPRMLVAGRGRVWEPSIVRLPDNEFEIFYANESPDLEQEGSSQCIESIRSSDGGQTWDTPAIVSENAGCRNGMPTALTLGNGHVVCAQEVVGLLNSPWIADTLQAQTRSYRLAQDRYDFGAAPFLARVADGSTLLAFHSQILQAATFKPLQMSWMFSQIYVQHGDADAKNFGPASCPWPPSVMGSGSFFPSLMVLNDGTIVALSSYITVHPDHTVSTVVRWIKGRLTASAAQAGKATNDRPAASKRIALASSAAEPTPAPAPRPQAEYKYGPPDDESGKSGNGY